MRSELFYKVDYLNKQEDAYSHQFWELKTRYIRVGVDDSITTIDKVLLKELGSYAPIIEVSVVEGHFLK